MVAVVGEKPVPHPVLLRRQGVLSWDRTCLATLRGTGDRSLTVFLQARVPTSLPRHTHCNTHTHTLPAPHTPDRSCPHLPSLTHPTPPHPHGRAGEDHSSALLLGYIGELSRQGMPVCLTSVCVSMCVQKACELMDSSRNAQKTQSYLNPNMPVFSM